MPGRIKAYLNRPLGRRRTAPAAEAGGGGLLGSDHQGLQALNMKLAGQHLKPLARRPHGGGGMGGINATAGATELKELAGG